MKTQTYEIIESHSQDGVGFSICFFSTSREELPFPLLLWNQEGHWGHRTNSIGIRQGREAEEPAGCWQEGAAGGEDADLANPSGFPELTQIKAIFLRGGW